MNPTITRELALKESPFNLKLVTDPTHMEYRKVENEGLVLSRWKPIVEKHGAKVWGIEDIPTKSYVLKIDDINWEIGQMNPTQTYYVPDEVFNRLRALESQGIPFGYWLWGEELLSRNQPSIRPNSELMQQLMVMRLETIRQPQRLGDPILIGVIPTAPNRGVWVQIGAWLH